jgi:MoxR-like ATPase
MDKNVFRKILENIVFAMNLSDDIPEHIITEMMRIKDRKVVNEMEAIFGTPVDFESVEDFNEEVNRNLKPRIGQQIVTRQEVVQQSEEFFSEIVGYSDVKELFMKCIQSNNMHVILDGPPASAKSLFLYEMLRNLGYDAYFVDCTNASGPGLVDYLFENNVKYLLLDEVEKMSNRDQNVLLNLMETGILTSTKVKKTRSKNMDISIYATTNDIEELSKPFRSRFMEFSLPPYTYDEFCDIAVKLLGKRYNHDKELSLKIADTVWYKIKSGDIRDLLQVGKLSKTLDDVDFVVNTLQKYKRKEGCEDWETGRRR